MKTSSFIYRRHIRNIIASEFLTHLLCVTYESKLGLRTGCAYSIQGDISYFGIRNSAATLVFPQLTLLSSPLKLFLLTTISLVSSFYSRPVFIQSYRPTYLYSSSLSVIRLIFSIGLLWIPGHINLPDHDAVDFPAKQSLPFSSISDHLPTPAYDLKTYYRSLMHNT